MARDMQRRPPEDTARLRRIETRLTQMMIALGVKTEAQSPEFSRKNDTAQIVLPSKHCTVKEALDSIPETWNGPVNVFVGDDCVATIARPRDRS